jgi:hypothetical protein
MQQPLKNAPDVISVGCIAQISRFMDSAQTKLPPLRQQK